MALIPRWQYMSDSSKAIVKNVAGIVLVLLIGLVLLRAFFGWIVLAAIIWSGWKVLNRK
jgi:divalent metal cation (Fe/Co/Zn/Cd) transporter